LQKKDEDFTRQIQLLFAALKTTEDQAGVQSFSGNYHLSIYSPSRLVEKSFDQKCLHHYYVSWRIHLLNRSDLPQIISVRAFKIHNHGYRYPWCSGSIHDYPPDHLDKYYVVESKLDLRIIVELATRFPNLEFLGCKVGGYEWCRTHGEEQPIKQYERDWEGPRRDSRHDFANVVASYASQLPSSLKRASLDFMNPLYDVITIKHDEERPDLVTPAIKDPFSSSLRILSNNLCQLQLRVMADETLFWRSINGTYPWPNLEILDVMFHMTCPTGSWYFQGPRGEGGDAVGFKVTEADYSSYVTSKLDGEVDSIIENWGPESGIVTGPHFRIAPNDSKLRALLEGFAKAANGMLSLKRAVLWSPLSWAVCGDEWDEGDYEGYDKSDCEELAWGIVFTEPGLPPGPLASREEYVPCQSRQLWWRVGKWRPDVELHRLFQGIGRDRFGDSLMESWIDHQYGDWLVFSEAFETIFFDEDYGRTPARR
jgi:hypothetical protein